MYVQSGEECDGGAIRRCSLSVILITAFLIQLTCNPANAGHGDRHMPDALADSAALIERLLKEIMKEKDRDRRDELAEEIWRVMEERENLKRASALQKPN